MRATLDPWLEYYRPPSVTSFRFTRFELGKRAPYFRTISVSRVPSVLGETGDFDTFQLDIAMEYMCELNAVVSAKLGFVPVPISIKDLKIVGVIRLIITVDPYWYVVVAKVSFLGKPDIDVTIKPLKGLDLMGVPALSSWLRNMIVDGIANTMSWPLQYVYDARDWVPPDEQTLQRKRLKVTIHGGRNLEARNMDNTSDPYVVVKLSDELSSRTRTISSTLNPIWNETFVFFVTDVRAINVDLAVFDEDRVLKNSPMGVASISLKAEMERIKKEQQAAMAQSAPSLEQLRTMTGNEDELPDTPQASSAAGVGGTVSGATTAAATTSDATAAQPTSALLSVRKWLPLQTSGSGELQVSLLLEVAGGDDIPLSGVLRVEGWFRAWRVYMLARSSVCCLPLSSLTRFPGGRSLCASQERNRLAHDKVACDWQEALV